LLPTWVEKIKAQNCVIHRAEEQLADLDEALLELLDTRLGSLVAIRAMEQTAKSPWLLDRFWQQGPAQVAWIDLSGGGSAYSFPAQIERFSNSPYATQS